MDVFTSLVDDVALHSLSSVSDEYLGLKTLLYLYPLSQLLHRASNIELPIVSIVSNTFLVFGPASPWNFRTTQQG